MNDYDRYNLQIRAAGRVFAGAQNHTRCSRCGAQGAEYDGEINDSGESIAVCPDGCGGYDDEEAA